MPSPHDLLFAETTVHLHAAGTSLLLDLGPRRLPEVVHWGADLGPLAPAAARAVTVAARAVHEQDARPPAAQAEEDGFRRLPHLAGTRSTVSTPVLPLHSSGWMGRPAIRGSRAGGSWSPRFTDIALIIDGAPHAGSHLEVSGPAVLEILAVDLENALRLRLEIELRASGLIRSRATLTARGRGAYALDELTMRLAVPERATERLDFTGRWARERVPQRSPITTGLHEREARRGRPGADAAFVTIVGTPGFGFGDGEVWGTHLAWSGNSRHMVERLSNGTALLGAGELLLPGEVSLHDGDAYSTPWMYAGHGIGLDALAARFHAELRQRPEHPSRPRPVTVNSWEAVYFDHSPSAMRDLAERAAGVGAERFVIDDGWFLGRRDERAGLGDWIVDPEVYPDGLQSIADRVRELDMEFGLWVEPEMISPSSRLAEEHPEWILRAGSSFPPLERHQQVLDLTRDDAFDYVLTRLSALVSNLDLAYLKWDHNRDLVDAGTAGDDDGDVRIPAVHRQVEALYRLLDELRRRHPGLEVESCSSGGARIDLGILARTDRVWASDVLDPLERGRIDAWTAQLVPPELIGSHVASPRSHITGRTHALSFRGAVPLLRHYGIEWDLRSADDRELAELRSWVRFHKKLRPLVASGTLVRLDLPDPSVAVSGLVAPDRAAAVFVAITTGRPETTPRAQIRLRGLDARRNYRVRARIPSSVPSGLVAPEWFGADGDGIVLTGLALEQSGLRLPPLDPEQALVLALDSTPQGTPEADS